MRVLATGVFDLLHVGHLRYLQYARAQGTHLRVAVTPEAFVLSFKKKCPVIAEAERLEMVRGVACVDAAEYMPSSLDEPEQTVAWMCAWGIEKVVVGGDWQGTPRWQRLIPLLVTHGILVTFAPHTPHISTTKIVARVLERGRQGTSGVTTS